MKSAVSLLAAVAFAAALCTGSAFAADAKTPTPQQQKFGACAKDAHAKGLKGDEYKAYMSTCAKADSATPAAAAPAAAVPAVAAAPAKPMTQQEKMTACNADAKAKTLTGDDRKKFMSSCLSSDGAAAH
jgi:hypothetical protein